jgi:hypothetical protein
MKKIITITAVAILGAASASWAHDEHLKGNEDLYGSMLMDHSPGSRGGEGQKGMGDLYGSHLANAEDVTPNPAAKSVPIDKRNALHDQDPEGYGFN